MAMNEVKAAKSGRRMKAGWKRCLAVMLAFAMVFSGTPLMPNLWRGGVEAKADMSAAPTSEAVTGPGAQLRTAAAGAHILDMAELADYVGKTFENKEYGVPGNDYFTIIGEVKLKIEANQVKDFGDYTSSHRFNPGGGADTSKRAVKFTTSSAAEVVVYWASGGDNRQMYILADGNIVIDKTEGTSTKNEIYKSTLKIENAGTYYLCGKDGSNYMYRVEITELNAVTPPTVSSVSAVQTASDTSGATVEVSFTGTAGEANSEYVVEASKDDGSTWVKVGTEDGTKTSGSVTVSLAKAELGYGTWKFRVKGSNEVVASETITYAASTYTLSGTYTGLGAEAMLTALVFKAASESYYEVPEVSLNNGAYSVVLEKGTTYEVSAEGVDEYSMTAPTGAFSYTEDATLNITFEKKVLYPVTISLGSTPDLTGKKLTYKFTHEDGAEYSFEDASAITLRNGSYTVAIGGDMAQMAYGIDKGGILKVDGAAVKHAITFKELTSWSFGADFTEKIEGKADYYQGLCVDATNNGKLAPNGNSAQFNTGTTIRVPVSGPCEITVTAYEPKYALYTIDGTAASTSDASTTISYDGGAGTVEIKSEGVAYIVGITLKYPVKEVEFVKQPVMPFVPENDTDANTAADTDGIPRQNAKDSITVQPEGQKLVLSQAGGSFADKFADTKNVAYYLFPMTDDNNTLEFDLLVTESKATGNNAGFFGGIFTNNYVSSLGLRAGGQKIRGIYTKNGGLTGGSFAGAGSPAEEAVGLNRPIHYLIEKTEQSKVSVTITFVDDEGAEQKRNFSQTSHAEPDGKVPTSFYYGFALANVGATITNMVYTAADGSVLYDQNACYYPSGSAPAATSVSAAAAESREYIDVTWQGSVPEGDGTYVVEMKKDNGEWTELANNVTGFSYQYVLSEGDGGNYLFRVCGQLGKGALGGSRNNYAEMTTPVYVVGALAKPVVTTKTTAAAVALDWQDVAGAEHYLVYRYSYDEGEDAASQLAKVTESAYTDSAVTENMPYYYTVKAVSDTANNTSPLSETVWTVLTGVRVGEYVYEDEATEITLTKKSYDTVFTDKAVLEGTVAGQGTLAAYVNGAEAASEALKPGASFSFELTLKEGRNDVNLIFTDTEGNKIRKTYNFVYLTNYDMVVDAGYAGADGTAVNGIPTYKTVQAAVDAVADSAKQTIILVLAGSYEERLVVNTPNISLIGEDRESTSIHCYPGSLGTDYEAGGDMKCRCAIYIQSGATGFSAENLSFANDYVYSTPDGKGNKSADALRCDADNATFVNVKLSGVQDTLYMDAGYQYYYKCLIEGLVDYIYSGNKARCFFEDCELRFVYESTKTAGYVCAPKTAEDAEYGLTFYNCAITSEEGCSGTGYLLARPWGADAYITWIDCYMGKAVNKTAPYGSMSGNMPEDARFFEYGTYGPGFEINTARRQISPAKAEKMTGDAYLGWSPAGVSGTVAAGYVGDIVTDRAPGYVTGETASDVYLWTDGDDTGLKAYDAEGYAAAYRVSGGGLLKENNANYYKAATAEEFLNALLAIKASGKKSVIELTADINLGSKEVDNYSSYSKIIKPYSAQALTHPTLMESGVSVLSFDGMSGITIFSSNASSIKHANITMKRSENIIIRNIRFDELWEWDEATEGDYDRNDWDYMTIDSSCNGIWIDHCTFYKAYDGIVDIKNPSPTANVTISWCEFLPGSEDNIFFDEMMDEIFANPEKYPTYQHMLESGMTKEQVYMYAYGQKKTHLLGQSDDAVNAKGIRLTMANNYYKNSMDRMPRLRYGYSHVYNCIMDAQELLDVKNTITNPDIAKKIVSNGAASTCEGQVLLENCYISGILNALNSGNGSSPSGYINAVNSVYYMNGEKTELAPKCNTTGDTRVLITDAEAFVSGLPYSDYILYDAEDLKAIVKPNAGAGKLQLTALQWEKVSYNAELTTDEPTKPDEPVEPDKPSVPDEPSEPDDSNDSFDDDYMADDDDSSDSSSSGSQSSSPSAGKPAADATVAAPEAEDEGSKGSWQKDDQGWWFSYTADSSYAKDSWHKINGSWYAFDEKGYMETGWKFDKNYNGWFFLVESGEMQTGWVFDRNYNSWFCMADDGKMQTGWVFDKGYNGWFYMQADGKMRTGWHLDANGKWYYLKPNGLMAASEKTPDGYYVDADGVWKK